jgi:NADH-quinone oxidoreductase subunit M
MTELHLPWLELAIVTPAIGALLIGRLRDPEIVWKRAMIATGATLILTICAWRDFDALQTVEAHDRWNAVAMLFGDNAIVIDEISAPLITLTALLYFVVMLATLKTKVRRFPFSLTLVSLALVLALLSCRAPWGIIGLLAAQLFPLWLELRARGRSTRVFTFHMLLFLGLLLAGWTMIERQGLSSGANTVAIGMLAAAVLIRSGVVPTHCWMTDLFENATLGTALLFVTPMSGAYTAVRLVLPIAPDWALHGIAILSLVTAVYAAGMALVQNEARRLFCFLFLSNASLVLVGLEVANATSLTGGLAIWLSVGISMVGLGLTLRAVEARRGRVSLAEYHGLYEHMPSLAVFFLLTGLASIGFPGTVGFVGGELLVEGAVQLAPLVGIIVVFVAALNGIACMRAYFRLFTGTVHTSSVSLEARWPEKVAVLTMTVLILGGGLFPQPGVSSRYRAALEILAQRRETKMNEDATEPAVVAVARTESESHISQPE